MTIFRFRDFELNTSSYTLYGPQGPIKLRDKVFQLLTVLIHNPNRVIAKERLFQELWPDTHVEPNALSQTVLELRKALASVDPSTQFVETVPKKGYRWACLDIKAVETLGEGFSPPPESDAEEPPPSGLEDQTRIRPELEESTTVSQRRFKYLERVPRRLFLLGILFVSVLAACILLVVYFRRPDMPRRNPMRVFVAPFVNQTGLADRDWVTLGLPKIIGVDLDRRAELSVIPLAPHLELFRRLETSKPARYDEEQLARVHRSVPFDVLISGGVTLKKGRFFLSITLHTKDCAFETTTMELANPSNVTRMISKTLEGKLGVSLVVMDDVFSSDPLVNELFGRGCQHIAFGEPAKAKPYFEICVNRDPDFLMAAHGLAECYDRMGQSNEAKELCGKILTQCDHDCSPTLVAGTRTLMGIAAFHLSEFSLAKEEFDRALGIYIDLDRPLNVAGTLNWIAGLKTIERSFHEAMRLYDEAWEIYEREEYWQGLAVVLSGQGDVLSQQGNLQEAAERWQRSMEYFAASGDRENQAAMLLRMADYHRSKGFFDKAQAELNRARKVFKELKVEKRLALTHNRLADLCATRGQLDEALDHGRQALELFERIGDTYNASVASYNSGCTALGMKDWPLARTFFSRSRQISENLDALPRLEGEVFAHLGFFEIAWHQNELETAQGHLQKASSLAQDNAYLKMVTSCYRAALAYRMGHHDAALRTCQAAKEMAGSSWNNGQEAYLKIYQRTAKTGRAEPLPMDRDPFDGPMGM